MKEARFHSMAISLLLLAVTDSMLVSSETTAEPALTLHVAVDGDDAAAGTAGEPLQSLPAAKQRVRDYLAQEPASDVLVILREGVYRLTEPLRFTAADNPAEDHTITWQAAENAHVRISGGRVIDNWELRDDGALVATLDEVAAGDWFFRELFVNGERRPRARYPSTGYARVAQVGEDRRTNFTFHAADIPEALDGDFTGRDLELVFFHEWSISRTPVASIDQSQARLNTSHPVGPLVLDFFVMDHWEPSATSSTMSRPTASRSARPITDASMAKVGSTLPSNKRPRPTSSRTTSSSGWACSSSARSAFGSACSWTKDPRAY
jgi:hypothetical protein